MKDFIQLSKDVEDYVIGIRRRLHKQPELSMQEEKTMKYVIEKLQQYNIMYEQIPDGGIIGTVEGGQEGKTLILRADLDALPMQESSENLTGKKQVVSEVDGVAHTCGHDAHTAILLGVAKILSEMREELSGRVLLVFEQGEELGGIGGGVYNLVNRLNEIGADGVWGLHLKNDLPSGKVSVDPGVRMAGAFVFDVVIHGSGGHGSRPDLSRSPIDCFHDFYHNLNVMLGSKLNPFSPLTISVGSLHAGTTENIIPESLQFTGTGRYVEYEQAVVAVEKMKEILQTSCNLYDCTYEFIKEPFARDMIVYNQEECSKLALQAIEKYIGGEVIQKFPMWMATEPFAYYQKYFPGIYAFLGIQNEEKGVGAEHHSPYFDVDEKALKNGVAATLAYTYEFLNTDIKIDFEREERSVFEFYKK